MYLINNFQHTKMYPTEFNLSSCALDTLSLQQNAVFLFQRLSMNVRPAEEEKNSAQWKIKLNSENRKSKNTENAVGSLNY